MRFVRPHKLVLREVNFIDQDEHRDVHVRDFGKRLRVREVVFVDVRDQQDEVGILKRVRTNIMPSRSL